MVNLGPLSSTEEDNDMSDIEKDMEVLSNVRDLLLVDIKKTKDAGDKLGLVRSVIDVIQARQNSELLQLRIWGMLGDHDHDEESCPDCGEPMENVPSKPVKPTGSSN